MKRSILALLLALAACAPPPRPETPTPDVPPVVVVPPVVEPEPPVPPRDPTLAEVLDYRGHLGHLRDSANRLIWSPALPGASPELRREWLTLLAAAGATHVPIGPFEAGPAYPGVEWSNPDWTRDAGAIRALVEEIRAAPTSRGHGLIPVVFLDGGGRDPRPRLDAFFPVAHDALRDFLDSILVVPSGWEPVVGDWSSADVSYALRKWVSYAPRSNIAYHGSPSRLVGSSNPVEADDPWNGGEADFYKSHGGEHIDIALYQTPHGRALYEPCDPNHESCWLDRWRDYVLRIGGGMNGWRQLPIVLYESCSYEAFRGQATPAQCRDLATRGKEICDAAGVACGYGDGLPWEMQP